MCTNDETRRQLEYAYGRRCIDANSAILERLVALRAEQAELLGYDDHRAFVLEERMAKTPARVESFLKDLSDKLEPYSQKELKQLLALKAEERESKNLISDGKINMWDARYYWRLQEERLYQVDQQKVKEYFPLDKVTKGLLGIYEELLGLKFEEILAPKKHVWHEDVRMFSVTDATTSRFIGQFYLDLHPREGKFGHAACFGLQPGCGSPPTAPEADRESGMTVAAEAQAQAEGKNNRPWVFPACAMVANFSKPTGGMPSLLEHSEVVTYFHEQGHCFHQLLSRATYPEFSGTKVERDFVEAPSQMLEFWCWEPEALKRMSGHYKTGEPLTDDMIDKLSASKQANAAMLAKRQICFGMFDQAIHAQSKVDTEAVFASVQQQVTGLTATPGTNFAASFGHLAGGYDCSYFGYMYAEVFAADMFYGRFKAEGLSSSKAGIDYRNCILAPGGSKDADEMLRDFLGRDPDMEPFLRGKGLLPQAQASL
ncbi:unnamed protein product [Chrysoparadoxa australica]